MSDKWAERQVRVLVECGVSLANAQAAIAFALKQMPAAADPNTYVLDAARLDQDVSSPALVQDARADFYANDHISVQYKRILDARPVQ